MCKIPHRVPCNEWPSGKEMQKAPLKPKLCATLCADAEPPWDMVGAEVYSMKNSSSREEDGVWGHGNSRAKALG